MNFIIDLPIVFADKVCVTSKFPESVSEMCRVENLNICV